jgi:hypothetical protein
MPNIEKGISNKERLLEHSTFGVGGPVAQIRSLLRQAQHERKRHVISVLTVRPELVEG